MKNSYYFVLSFILMAVQGFAQLPIPIMNQIHGPGVVCSGPPASYNYSTSASNSPNSYQWSVSSPSTGVVINFQGSDTTNITFPNTNLTYTIYCTASNSSGVSTPTYIIVKVYETPSVTFSGAQNFCQGSSTNLFCKPNSYFCKFNINL